MKTQMFKMLMPILVAAAFSPAVNAKVASGGPNFQDHYDMHIVSDIKKIKSFYGDQLGLPISMDQGSFVQFKVGNTFLSFLERQALIQVIGNEASVPATDKSLRSEIFIHLEDAEPLYNKLVSLGTEVISPLGVRPWGERAGYFRDPEGNLLALADHKN